MSMLWYFIMFSCLLTAVVNIKNPDSVTTWLGISILGLFLFELIFEAQARHLYSFLPVFVVYGCLGYFKKSRQINSQIDSGQIEIENIQ